MADPLPPAIARQIEHLLSKAKEMTSLQMQNLEILLKTIDLKDAFGVKMRTAEVVDYATKLHWIAAQIEALRSIAYELPPSDTPPPGPKRRPSSQMVAVHQPIPREEPDEK